MLKKCIICFCALAFLCCGVNQSLAGSLPSSSNETAPSLKQMQGSSALQSSAIAQLHQIKVGNDGDDARRGFDAVMAGALIALVIVLVVVVSSGPK